MTIWVVRRLYLTLIMVSLGNRINACAIKDLQYSGYFKNFTILYDKELFSHRFYLWYRDLDGVIFATAEPCQFILPQP